MNAGQQRIGNKVFLNFNSYVEYHSQPRSWDYQNYDIDSDDPKDAILRRKWLLLDAIL